MELLIHRKENKKRNARRGRRLLLAGALGVALASSAALYWERAGVARAGAIMLDAVLFNRYFAVSEIQVRGGEKVGGSEIVATAGLRHGMNIWKIDPRSIEQKVAKHPWVRKVVVRREFPRRVVIEVEERVPKAIVALGKLYFVDAEGVVFKEVGEGEDVNFPLLTGLRPEDLSAPDRTTRRKIQDAIRLGELMGSNSLTLSEIHFDAQDRLVLYTMSFPVALHMGWGDWSGKLQRLERVFSLWKGKEDRLAALDLSFRDQVVARLRRVGKP